MTQNAISQDVQARIDINRRVIGEAQPHQFIFVHYGIEGDTNPQHHYKGLAEIRQVGHKPGKGGFTYLSVRFHGDNRLLQLGWRDPRILEIRTMTLEDLEAYFFRTFQERGQVPASQVPAGTNGTVSAQAMGFQTSVQAPVTTPVVPAPVGFQTSVQPQAQTQVTRKNKQARKNKKHSTRAPSPPAYMTPSDVLLGAPQVNTGIPAGYRLVMTNGVPSLALIGAPEALPAPVAPPGQ